MGYEYKRGDASNMKINTKVAKKLKHVQLNSNLVTWSKYIKVSFSSPPLPPLIFISHIHL
jgi:hypothetical protein